MLKSFIDTCNTVSSWRFEAVARITNTHFTSLFTDNVFSIAICVILTVWMVVICNQMKNLTSLARTLYFDVDGGEMFNSILWRFQLHYVNEQRTTTEKRKCFAYFCSKIKLCELIRYIWSKKITNCLIWRVSVFQPSKLAIGCTP